MGEFMYSEPNPTCLTVDEMTGGFDAEVLAKLTGLPDEYSDMLVSKGK